MTSRWEFHVVTCFIFHFTSSHLKCATSTKKKNNLGLWPVWCTLVVYIGQVLSDGKLTKMTDIRALSYKLLPTTLPGSVTTEWVTNSDTAVNTTFGIFQIPVLGGSGQTLSNLWLAGYCYTECKSMQVQIPALTLSLDCFIHWSTDNLTSSSHSAKECNSAG